MSTDFVSATCSPRGHGLLQRLEGDTHPGLHQVLLLRHGQPPGAIPQQGDAHPGGAGTLYLQGGREEGRHLEWLLLVMEQLASQFLNVLHINPIMFSSLD